LGKISRHGVIFATSWGILVLRMFKGVERGVGLFRSTILKLRALSLRSVMESLQAVRKKESLSRYEIDHSQLAVAYISAPMLKSTGKKGSRSCGPWCRPLQSSLSPSARMRSTAPLSQAEPRHRCTIVALSLSTGSRA
jgi:hypothetical protein